MPISNMCAIKFAPIMGIAAKSALAHAEVAGYTVTNPNSTEDLARRIRLHALRMCKLGGGSHIGSVFSCADILAVLYGGILRLDPLQPHWLWPRSLHFEQRPRLRGTLRCAGRARLLPARPTRHALSKWLAALRARFPQSSRRRGIHLRIARAWPVRSRLRHGPALWRRPGAINRISVFALLSDGECDEADSVWEAK